MRSTLGVVAGFLLLATLLAPSCAEPQTGCTLPEDCGPGQICVDGRCVSSSTDGGTDADADAPGDATDAGDGAGDAAGDDGGDGTGADGNDDGIHPCGTASFEVSDTQEEFIVPPDVLYMHVKAWGAGANGEGACTFDDGGLGGYSEAVFETSPGTRLIIIVGKRGRSGMTGEEIVRFGFGSWGGGGLSGVFLGPEAITEHDRDRALIIAGGGGSAGAPDCAPGGTGNHPSSGGEATMLGSIGADDVNGGGGGYSGGTGGARGEAGRGGSGFVAASALDSRMLSVEPGAGVAPNEDDPDYVAPAGRTEESGRVVIHFTCEPPTIL